MAWSGPIPKPEPYRRVKARRQRQETAVKKSVRAQCVERDGYCRIGNWEDNPDDYHSDAVNDITCEGASEWAHIGDNRRSKTRGMAAEKRHTTAGSCMLCQEHHKRYDAHEFDIIAPTSEGMDGPIEIVWRAA